MSISGTIAQTTVRLERMATLTPNSVDWKTISAAATKAVAIP